MTQRLLICTMSLLVAAAASAQTVTGGVRVGVDLSTVPGAGAVMDQISGAPSVDVTAKVGVTGGGFVKIDLTERFAFQPELMFVMKGVELEQAAESGTVTAGINYIEFPLLLRYTDYLSDEVRGYLVGGATIAFKAGTSSELSAPDQTRELNIDPAFASRDTGIAGGLGLVYGRYLLDVRYSLGLSDIATGVYGHSDSLKTRVFAVTVGLTFP
jgi:hypothetical protein